MTYLPDKLRLKELAEEDIYFAERDRELIKALHERKLAKLLDVEAKKGRKKTGAAKQKYAKTAVTHRRKHRRFGRFYRSLIKKVLMLTSKKRN